MLASERIAERLPPFVKHAACSYDSTIFIEHPAFIAELTREEVRHPAAVGDAVRLLWHWRNREQGREVVPTDDDLAGLFYRVPRIGQCTAFIGEPNTAILEKGTWVWAEFTLGGVNAGAAHRFLSALATGASRLSDDPIAILRRMLIAHRQEMTPISLRPLGWILVAWGDYLAGA